MQLAFIAGLERTFSGLEVEWPQWGPPELVEGSQASTRVGVADDVNLLAKASRLAQEWTHLEAALEAGRHRLRAHTCAAYAPGMSEGLHCRAPWRSCSR